MAAGCFTKDYLMAPPCLMLAIPALLFGESTERVARCPVYPCSLLSVDTGCTSGLLCCFALTTNTPLETHPKIK